MVYCNNTKDGRKLKRDCIKCNVDVCQNCENCMAKSEKIS